MERLSGMDASFFYMETPDMHFHVMGTILLDPSTMPGGYSFERIKENIASRLHLIPPFRRRLVEVPFNLAHPLWIEDPDFDLDSHVHRIGLPAPHTMRELAEFVGHLASSPLDRSRPLWEMWVVEGLEDGNVAIVTKMHHSAIDGVTGADLMVHLFDLEPEGQPAEPPAAGDRPADHKPNDIELVAGAVTSAITQPFGLARMLTRTVRTVFNIVQNQRQPDAPPATLPFTAPHTPFNGAITRHRSVAYSRASLDDLKTIKKAFGCTINDVVLAACSITMRRWLADHGGVPDKPLVASIPISVHDVVTDSPGVNKVSAMLVRLPTNLEDPVAVIESVHEDTKGAKEFHKAMGADMLTGLAEFAPPRLLNRASRLYSQLNLANRHRPLHNIVISNIPGPPVPLYTSGARVLATYPMGPILEGAGLNITVLSNMGNVDFGAIACKELVPDIWDVADGFAEAVAILKKAAAERG